MSSPPPKPSRQQLLSAIPQKNQLVRQSPLPNGLRLTAPFKPNPLRKLLAPNTPYEKSFDLDPLGQWVWQNLDPAVTVESLIQKFAAHHRVNLREAEVSLLAFLKTLIQKNLIALTAPKP